MNFGDMTNEEWEEVRRHHDDMVHMEELELHAEEIREHSADRTLQPSSKPVERQLQDLEDVVLSLSH